MWLNPTLQKVWGSEDDNELEHWWIGYLLSFVLSHFQIKKKNNNPER